MIRVALADDHPVFREGLQLLLESTGDIEVVGVAGNGVELLELLEQPGLEVDVVVLDLDMPVLDGVATARRVAAARPGLGMRSRRPDPRRAGRDRPRRRLTTWPPPDQPGGRTGRPTAHRHPRHGAGRGGGERTAYGVREGEPRPC